MGRVHILGVVTNNTDHYIEPNKEKQVFCPPHLHTIEISKVM